MMLGLTVVSHFPRPTLLLSPRTLFQRYVFLLLIKNQEVEHVIITWYYKVKEIQVKYAHTNIL